MDRAFHLGSSHVPAVFNKNMAFVIDCGDVNIKEGNKMINKELFEHAVTYFCNTYCTEYLSDIVITDCLGRGQRK